MVFLLILLVIILLIILLVFSKISIQIINFKFKSQADKHINKDYKIIIRLYVLGKIPIMKLNITKTKMEKVELKEKLKSKLVKLDTNLFLNKNKFDRDFIKAIKTLNLAIKNINLNIELGTENAAFTSIIVPAISTIIAIYFRKKVQNFENQTFIINPVYINQNLINITISGIFEIKIIHIIDIIYIMTKKKGRVNENERTSNRRAYGYSYE